MYCRRGRGVAVDLAHLRAGEIARWDEAFELHACQHGRSLDNMTGAQTATLSEMVTGTVPILRKHGLRAKKPPMWSSSPNEAGLARRETGGVWDANGSGSRQACQSADKDWTKALGSRPVSRAELNPRQTQTVRMTLPVTSTWPATKQRW